MRIGKKTASIEKTVKMKSREPRLLKAGCESNPRGVLGNPWSSSEPRKAVPAAQTKDKKKRRKARNLLKHQTNFPRKGLKWALGAPESLLRKTPQRREGGGKNTLSVEKKRDQISIERGGSRGRGGGGGIVQKGINQPPGERFGGDSGSWKSLPS